jgi:hypothetical protein
MTTCKNVQVAPKTASVRVHELTDGASHILGIPRVADGVRITLPTLQYQASRHYMRAQCKLTCKPP